MRLKKKKRISRALSDYNYDYYNLDANFINPDNPTWFHFFFPFPV